MASIDCVVDTRPMAKEIDSVSNHIKGTTAAVVGMRVAVLKAEEEASEHVCENVNRGFYALIHSQISQKIAKYQSEVDSHVMKLTQQRKRLLAIKDRMERDYGMLSGRYLKLFTSLNQNLRMRVTELDKPVINLAVKETERISNRSKYLTATVPVSQSESLETSQKILASNLKSQGANVIEIMSRFLGDMYAQNKLTERILLPVNVERNELALAVPTIICESNYDQYNNMRLEVVVPQKGLSNAACQSIQNAIREQSASMEWETGKAVDQEVKSEFDKILSASTASERVKKMTAQLFHNSNYQTIKPI